MSPHRRDLRRAARFLVLPTLALVFVVAFVPGRAGIALRIYAILLAAVVLLLLVAALRRAYTRATPVRRPDARRRRVRDVPATLHQLEQEVSLGVAGSFYLHYRLRPRLRSLAEELLEARRGISLDAEPERARDALGEETWALIRPDRPPPEDRLARGIAIPELDRIVESLETT